MLTSLGADAHGAVDEALAKLKLKRTVALVTPGFLAVPFVVARAPLITTMPLRLARYFADAFQLATSPAPVELPSLAVSLIWHASFDHDPGHAGHQHPGAPLAEVPHGIARSSVKREICFMGTSSTQRTPGSYVFQFGS